MNLLPGFFYYGEWCRGLRSAVCGVWFVFRRLAACGGRFVVWGLEGWGRLIEG
jgi:hypothetical protein